MQWTRDEAQRRGYSCGREPLIGIVLPQRPEPQSRVADHGVARGTIVHSESAMSVLPEVLDEIPEEKAVAVSFADGEMYLFKNFTPVDESIYDRSDLYTAVIVRASASKALGSNVGSLAQFSILDVAQVVDPATSRVLFSVSSGEAR
mgnify:CR=1 FL=1